MASRQRTRRDELLYRPDELMTDRSGAWGVSEAFFPKEPPCPHPCRSAPTATRPSCAASPAAGATGPPRPPRARRVRQGPPAGARQRAGGSPPRGGGAARRHDRADARGLDPPLQCRGRGGLARPTPPRPALRPRRRSAGHAQGAHPARPEPGARRLRRLARPRPVRPRRGAVRGPLRRERDAQAAQGPRPIVAEDPAGPPRGRPEGAGAVQKDLPGVVEGLPRERPGERVELWFMDEARIGQKGRLTHVWYQKGVRPRGVRQQGFASTYLFGAVCPERGEGVALVLPEVSTAAMDVFLAELSRAVPAGSHAALVLDGAGWHVSEELSVPANLTLIHPPPYSPELNPVERVWEYLRDRWLSHRVLAGGHEAVVDAACAAWNALLAEPGRLRSLTSFPWLPPAVSTS